MGTPVEHVVLSIADWPGLREAIGEMPGLEVLEWNLDRPAPRERIDIVMPKHWLGVAPLARLAGVQVQLLQWSTIGFHELKGHVPVGLPVANAATVHETATAEFTLGVVIAAQRELPRFVRNALEGRWEAATYPSLADQRVLLVGYGGVGKAIDARFGGFEADLTRVARTARDERGPTGDTIHVHGVDELRALLVGTDIVIIAAPLTTETLGLFDAAMLAALPDNALVVNMGRGPIVVTDDLLAETRSGRLRAVLDVTDPEPLPRGHPLWRLPNVLVTPHVGGHATSMVSRMASLLRRQVTKIQAGETPENLVMGAWPIDSGV